MNHDRLLQPTRYLDFQHPAVAALVREATSGAATERERAVAWFLRVRDGVRYDPYSATLEPEDFCASATLARGRGYCVTKAILFAAGLRALGIPARLGFADVVNHLATRRLVEQMKTEVFAYHGYVEAFVEGRWVKATPAFNATLCEKFGTAPLEWDGRSDAMLQPLNRRGERFMEYVRDRGTFDDFDLADMLRAWRELYPHLFEAGPGRPAGDFEAEAEAERRGER